MKYLGDCVTSLRGLISPISIFFNTFAVAIEKACSMFSPVFAEVSTNPKLCFCDNFNASSYETSLL